MSRKRKKFAFQDIIPDEEKALPDGTTFYMKFCEFKEGYVSDRRRLTSFRTAKKEDIVIIPIK